MGRMDRGDGAPPALGANPLQVGGADPAALEERLEFAEHEAWLAEALHSLPPDERAAVLSHVMVEGASAPSMGRERSSEKR